MCDLALLFKTFSDDTRLRMLVLLSRHGELCVCDFEEVLGLGQSSASRHLRHLIHAGLVDDERRRTWVYYRLRDPLAGGREALVSALRTAAPEARVVELDEALCAEEVCPIFPRPVPRLHWGLPDPAGKGIEPTEVFGQTFITSMNGP